MKIEPFFDMELDSEYYLDFRGYDGRHFWVHLDGIMLWKSSLNSIRLAEMAEDIGGTEVAKRENAKK